MRLNRAELQEKLDHLEASVPGLMESQDHHFIEAFAALANAIGDLASPGADRCWVEDQAELILVRCGHIPPHDEAA